MVKANTFWRTGSSGLFVAVTEVADGWVFYTIDGKEYSCLEGAFKERFFYTVTKPSNYIPL